MNHGLNVIFNPDDASSVNQYALTNHSVETV